MKNKYISPIIAVEDLDKTEVLLSSEEGKYPDNANGQKSLLGMLMGFEF